MGCSAAKNLAVEPLNGGASMGNGESQLGEVRKVSVTRRASEVPALEGVEPQTEMLENGTVNNMHEKSNGLSFDIAFGEEADESIIKKHPPKRFQRLEEQQQEETPNLSLAKLQEKLDEAEIRRQQILKQRVASAKVRTAIRRQNNVNNDDGLPEPSDLLNVPPDIPKTP
ncbi:PREDICTED: uncharacterized protein LOC108564549 [Nicrophorus vespilloides]|uniref:Uncharacterized protein LOC108564549 n=1 Tax=Nicrophorus vespilloides TaxID=110193 RepID=A0ABM1MX13_NICVS|nr:PREDICTED: uncharacterized protein LOC108564549 [Nicrophorus vespilloides]